MRRVASSSRRGGFTLVELLVVVGIIVVLVAILLPVVNGIRRTATLKRMRMDLHTIELGLEAYKQVFNDYPRQYSPDWSNGRTAPERVLAKYLLGWDPDPNKDGVVNVADLNLAKIDYQGVRGPSGNAGRKWGPYIPPDKFKVDIDNPTNPLVVGNLGATASNIQQNGKLFDESGAEIQYYPRWHETNPALPNSLLGAVTRKSASSGAVARFNLRDGMAYSQAAQREHILFMLGDGVADTKKKTATDYNGKIDGAESLQFQGEYMLISAGIDREFGLKPGETRHDKVDDVFNFERQ